MEEEKLETNMLSIVQDNNQSDEESQSESIVIENTDNKDKGSQQARRWLLTINNPEDKDFEWYKSDEVFNDYLENMEHRKYVAWQREKGHEEETIHFQVFIIFEIGKRFATVQKLFPFAHIEATKGSNAQARLYCTKSDTRVSGPYEIGEFAEQRSRTDIKEFMELIESGADNRTLRQLYPRLFLDKMDKIDKLRLECLKETQVDKIRDIKVVYIYGGTGVGKSYAIHNKYKDKDLYVVSDYHRDSWYSYMGQTVVLFEEYRSDFRLKEMLQYLDCYSIELPARYYNKPACYNIVFVVSNIPLSQQYKNTDNDNESKRAFFRRFHYVLNFQTRDKIIVEKAPDRSNLDELKNLLPDYLSDKLYINELEELKENVMPFNNEQQQIIDEIF